MLATRKRSAGFLLEKPLVSRLPFEAEHPPSIAVAAPHKRPKVAAGELDERQYAITLSEVSETQGCGGEGLQDGPCREEEIDAVGEDFDANRGCWSGNGGGDGGRGDRRRSWKGEHADCSEKTLDELSAIAAGAAPAPPRAPAVGSSGKFWGTSIHREGLSASERSSRSSLFHSFVLRRT